MHWLRRLIRRINAAQDGYPDACLRGLRKKDWILDDGKIDTAAFMPSDPGKETGRPRPDGAWEVSINWEDDPGAIEQLKRESVAAHGAARLPRRKLEGLMDEPGAQGLLDYERQPVDNNPYHGNILLHAKEPRHRRMIAAALAIRAKSVSS